MLTVSVLIQSMHLDVELSSNSWEVCQVDDCSHQNVLCGSRDATEVSSKLQFSFFFFFRLRFLGCLLAFNLSRLQPVITGAITGLGTCCIVVLRFLHLWKHLQYHFCSQHCGLWCAAKYLMFKGLVWHSFNTSVPAICPCLLCMGSWWRRVGLQCKFF